MTGGEAKSAVASELTAMFEMDVLPWIQSFYLHQDKSIEQLCIEYAQLRGLPEHEWPSIHIPASFVIDNDPRHAAMRQYLALPRVDMLAMQKQWLQHERSYQQKRDEELGDGVAAQRPASKRRRVFAYTQQPQAYNLQMCDVMLDRATEDAPADVRRAKRRRDERRSDEAVLDRFAAENAGLDMYQLRVFHKSLTDCRYLSVRPEQWAEHPPNTPEMNCPAEHMVHTLKDYVGGKISDAHCNLELLKYGRTLQVWILEAVEKLANGAKGRWHIMRSIEKLPCIHKILAGVRGVKTKVQYIFKRWAPHEHAEQVAADPVRNRDHGRTGHPQFDRRKAHYHQAVCTGGYRIENPNFT